MEKKGLKKTTNEQFSMIVEEMKKNPKLARGYPAFGKSKTRFEQKWTAISAKLNASGPPQRSMQEWKKIWADLKSRTKKKMFRNKRSRKSSDGSTLLFNPLTEMEQAVATTFLLTTAGAASDTKSNASSLQILEEIHDEELTLEELRKQNTIAEAHAEAARVLAEAAKAQVEATKIIADAMTIQAEATKQIVAAMQEFVRVLKK